MKVKEYAEENGLIPEKMEPDPLYDWQEEQRNDPDYEKWARELDKPF